MDWMTFVLEVLKALVEVVKAGAWPIVTLFIAVRYHKPILDLVKKLTKAKAFGAELEFDRKVQEVAEDAQELPKLQDFAAANKPMVTAPEPDALPIQSAAPDLHVDPRKPKLGTEFFELSPEQAEIQQLRKMMVSSADSTNYSHTILFAWNVVEKAMRRLLESQDIHLESLTNTNTLVRSIKEAKLLPNEHIRVINKLRELRNSIAHTQESEGPSKVSVFEYVLSAEKVIEAIAMRADIPF